MIYGTEETKYAIVHSDGSIALSEAKTLNEMSKEQLIGLVNAMQNRIDVMNAEKEAIIETQNKFLAKDHGETLQQVLSHQGQSERRY